MVSLRQLRGERFWSVRNLADRAGVSPQTVMAIEHGKWHPRYQTMQRLAEALNVPPGEIDEFRAAADYWTKPRP